MEPWFKVATPRPEIRMGRSLDPSEFAVHLEQIVSGIAPNDYKKPDQFFRRTYFSSALKDYCGIVLRRLSGETANTAPVITLLTQFGGGKTHTLATLYHLLKNGNKSRQYEGVTELLSFLGIAEIPKARIAVFVGNAWDDHDGLKTPWIDIAEQLLPGKGKDILGETHASAITSYLTKFPPMTDRIDGKTVEEWALLGDPSLKIGGYS